ncbi:MAG: inositol monophosphatase [Alphaproteobacteria bacterium]|nr:inositol monophosphatase [Alphaproteobacteria bacterium]
MTDAASKAARGLMRHFNEVESLQVSPKGPNDYVTNADLRAEATLVEMLQKARPGFAFLLEEKGEIAGTDGEHRWIIDPLDGTTNFMHGIPHFCISIGLEKTLPNGKTEIIAGLIMNPATQNVYWAEKGGGAFSNSRRMRVSNNRDLSKLVLATGGASFREKDSPNRFAILRTLAQQVHTVRCQGSAALDLAYVASGKYDGFWQKNLKPWDIAAGVLLVQEAGGRIVEINGGSDFMTSGSILATNGHVGTTLETLIHNTLKQPAA